MFRARKSGLALSLAIYSSIPTVVDQNTGPKPMSQGLFSAIHFLHYGGFGIIGSFGVCLNSAKTGQNYQ